MSQQLSMAEKLKIAKAKPKCECDRCRGERDDEEEELEQVLNYFKETGMSYLTNDLPTPTPVFNEDGGFAMDAWDRMPMPVINCPALEGMTTPGIPVEAWEVGEVRNRRREEGLDDLTDRFVEQSRPTGNGLFAEEPAGIPVEPWEVEYVANERAARQRAARHRG